MKKLLIKIFNSFGYTVQKNNKQSFAQLAIINQGKEIVKKISPDFTILNGPFRGIKYPSIDFTEMTLVPKISGSYEIQLNRWVYEIEKTTYNAILDIGCAEGYYAVGFGRMLPNSTVHCFDINKHDLQFCKKMADLNNVKNLEYHNFCSADTLVNFDYGNKSLIFCDCEGYELELFTDAAILALSNTDVLVELHDVVNPIISETLIERFQKTHEVKITNNSNLDLSNLKGLENLTPREKAFATYEHRGGLYQNIFMEWAFFTPKNKNQNAEN